MLLPENHAIILANVNILNPKHLGVYIWLNYFCEQTGNNEWEVDYKVLKKLSGISIKNLSLAIKRLELGQLINVERNRKVTVSMNELPEQILRIQKALFAEAEHIDKLKRNNQRFAIDPKVILQS